VLLLAVKLHWLPANGTGDGGATDALRHLVLPVTTLTLATTGHFVRYVRGAMVET
jgi:peptide/nickel transport system permease protein